MERLSKNKTWPIMQDDKMETTLRIPPSIWHSRDLRSWLGWNPWLGTWGDLLAFWFKSYVSELSDKKVYIHARLIDYSIYAQELVEQFEQFCDEVKIQQVDNRSTIDCYQCSLKDIFLSRIFSNPDVDIPSGIYVVSKAKWEYKKVAEYLENLEDVIRWEKDIATDKDVLCVCYSVDNEISIPPEYVKSKSLETSLTKAAHQFGLKVQWNISSASPSK